MNGRKVISLVAGRELRERGRSRSFRGYTVILAVALVAAVVLPMLLGDDARTFRVGVVGDEPASLRPTLEAFVSSLDGRIRVTSYRSIRGARTALRDDQADLAITSAQVMIRGQGTDEETKALADQVARGIAAGSALEAAGISSTRVPELLAPRPIPVRSLILERADQEASRQVIFVGLFLLYVALITYGTWVGMGVLEEKSSRIVEVLLSTVRPHQLLAGKVLGIGALGLIQLVIVAAVGLAAAMAVGRDIPASTPQAAALVLLYFVLGFALFSCLYAAIGASVSRQEDAQNALGPLTMVIVISYLIALGVLSDPNGTVARLGAVIPPLGPLVMPARLVLGDAAWWELPVSLVTILGASYALIRVGGRAYAGGLLRFGGVRLRDAYRATAATPS